MSHTLGPWTNEPNLNDEYSRVISAPQPNSTWKCFTMATVNGYSPDEADSNANLIASAPDMLKALEIVRDYFGDDYSPPEEIVGPVNDAIAKATGSEK